MKEVANFDAFCKSSYSVMVQRLWGCIKGVKSPGSNMNEVVATAESVADGLIKFNVFLGRGYRFFLRLKHEFDIVGGKPSGVDQFGEELAASFASANFAYGDIVCMLSDIYSVINSLRYGESQDNQATNFNGYKVKKYFIKPDDVLAVKLKVCSQLPVYNALKQKKMQKSGRPENALDDNYDHGGEGDVTKYYNVYFDNEKNRLYHDKIFRKEGSCLIKVKWDSTNPKECSVERKRTSFAVDNHSLTDKVELPYDRVGDFLMGRMKPLDLSRGRQAGSEEIVHTANTIQKMMDKLNLRPVLQTQLSRAVFQRAHSGLQIWIDTDLFFCEETGQGNWCSNMDQNSSTSIFPLAVMTLKIPKGVSVPDWLKKLVESDYILNECDFSKFLQGTSKFNTFKCDVLPAWYSRPVTHNRGYPISQWWRVHLNNDLAMMFSNIDPAFAVAMAQNKTDAKLIEKPKKIRSRSSSPHKGKQIVELEDDIGYSLDSSSSDELHKESKESERSRKSITPAIPRTKAPRGDEKVVTLVETKTEPEKPPTNTPTPQNTTSPIWADPDTTEDQNQPQQQPGLWGAVDRLLNLTSKAKSKDVTPLLNPIRVEPKTYFANERTLLAWINIATFLAIGSFALLSAAGSAARSIGIGILVIALLFVLYSLGVYHFRRNAIVSRSVDGHYDDKWGPTFLVIVLFCYIVFAMIFQATAVVPVNLPNARANREYRIPLAASFLNTPNMETSGFSSLNSAIQTAVPKFPLRGSFSYNGNQTVNWFDTRNSCLLKQKGLKLQEMRGVDLAGVPYTLSSLEILTEDYQYVSQLDNAYLYTTFNATEVIRPNNIYLYGREKTATIPQSPTLSTLQNLAMTFNTFFLWDFISPANWAEPLVQVSPIPMKQYNYGNINALFGTSTNSKLAKIGISLWYSSGNTPVYGELIISFPVQVGQDLSKQEIIDAKYFFNQISSLPTYFDTATTKSSSDFIYISNPTFCT
eukprot:TRINITY_DN8442_c0_g1_i1.p1 TRINITY_DN8442_c0_g1~~TRINITY_DN8442_c0_g1_i1.p1  ORF type:complete len:1014 (+),score=225.10 TRINITY_DN8442_c0_g1_i1:114-3044(+)